MLTTDFQAEERSLILSQRKSDAGAVAASNSWILNSFAAYENPSANFTTPSTKLIRSAHLMKKVDIPKSAVAAAVDVDVETSKKKKKKRKLPNSNNDVADGPHMYMNNNNDDDGPHMYMYMNREEFESRYPHMNLGITMMYPCSEMSEFGKDMIRDSLGFISPDQLNQVEDEWREYYREDCKRDIQEATLGNLESQLIEKASKAYYHSLTKH